LNSATASKLLSAAIDGCARCQEIHRTAVLRSPGVVTALAGLAYLTLSFTTQVATGLLGRLAKTGDGAAPTVGWGLLAEPTRALFEMFNRGDPVGGELLVEGFGRKERGDVLDDALDLLAGVF
jgi:hypothetical protein